MKLIKVEKVDEDLLQEIVRRIVSAINPLKIILFGSYAYGTPHKGSDLDILILVVRARDIEEWKDVPMAFIVLWTNSVVMYHLFWI